MGSFSAVNGAMVHAHACVCLCVCAIDRGGAAQEEQGSRCLLLLPAAALFKADIDVSRSLLQVLDLLTDVHSKPAGLLHNFNAKTSDQHVTPGSAASQRASESINLSCRHAVVC